MRTDTPKHISQGYPRVYFFPNELSASRAYDVESEREPRPLTSGNSLSLSLDVQAPKRSSKRKLFRISFAGILFTVGIPNCDRDRGIYISRIGSANQYTRSVYIYVRIPPHVYRRRACARAREFITRKTQPSLLSRENSQFLYSRRDISFRGANSFNIDTHLSRDTP